MNSWNISSTTGNGRSSSNSSRDSCRKLHVTFHGRVQYVLMFQCCSVTFPGIHTTVREQPLRHEECHDPRSTAVRVCCFLGWRTLGRIKQLLHLLCAVRCHLGVVCIAHASSTRCAFALEWHLSLLRCPEKKSQHCKTETRTMWFSFRIMFSRIETSAPARRW